MSLEPIEHASAILGEHFDNFVVIVAKGKHNAQIEYSNSFAATGLLRIGERMVDGNLNILVDDSEIIWEIEEDDENEE